VFSGGWEKEITEGGRGRNSLAVAFKAYAGWKVSDGGDALQEKRVEFGKIEDGTKEERSETGSPRGGLLRGSPT